MKFQLDRSNQFKRGIGLQIELITVNCILEDLSLIDFNYPNQRNWTNMEGSISTNKQNSTMYYIKNNRYIHTIFI